MALSKTTDSNPVIGTLICPLTWALASLLTYMEAPGIAFLQGPDSASTTFNLSSFLSPAATVLIYIVLLAATKRIKSLLHFPWLIGLSFVLCFLGSFIANSEGLSFGFAIREMGECAISIGTTIFMLLIIEELANVSFIQVVRVLVASGILNGIFVGLVEVTTPLLSLVFLITGTLFLALGLRSFRPPLVEASKEKPATLRSAVTVLVGISLLGLAFGFLQSLLYQKSILTIAIITTSTKLGAVLLFVVILHFLQDTSYALLAKIFTTLTAAGYILFLALGNYAPIASVLMNIGYSLFELTLLLAMVNLSHALHISVLRISCFVYLFENIGYYFGLQIALVSTNLPNPDIRIIAALITLLLIGSAIWIFNERNINNLFWSGVKLSNTQTKHTNDKGDTEIANQAMVSSSTCEKASLHNQHPLTIDLEYHSEQTHTLSFDEKIASLAHSHNLTPRETEVLALFASGRSAAFIGELTFVTTNTVRSHIKHIYSKLDVHSRQELITLIENVSE